MNEQTPSSFTAYEYKEVSATHENASLYLDCYESFGWQQGGNFPPKESGGKVTFRLKRSRKLVNRTELTRLQRHFEANMEEIHALEASRSSTAAIWALAVGLLGTAFMAGSVFAITASPPHVTLCNPSGHSSVCRVERAGLCLPKDLLIKVKGDLRKITKSELVIRRATQISR